MLLLEIWKRIDGAPVDTSLEVEVGARGVAGAADRRDLLAARDALPRADRERGQVSVEGRDTSAVVDRDDVAVSAHRADVHDSARIRGNHRRARAGRDVHTC